MSCSSPFEVEVVSEMVYTPFLFKCDGELTVPALTIPGSVTCDWWATKGGLKSCQWVPATYKSKKVCGWVPGTKKKCWTAKTLQKLGWIQCSWVKPTSKCNSWIDWPEVVVFPQTNIPMTANIPFQIGAGTEVVISDEGVEPLLIVQYAIYESLVINGKTETFKLSMNFGAGLVFPFYLPKDEVITVTDCNGSFSITIPLYDFGTFPTYNSLIGFDYTLSMSVNLLICFPYSGEWLKLQVVTDTVITGNGIPKQNLNITYAIPIVPAE